jgi:hypothetical protein
MEQHRTFLFTLKKFSQYEISSDVCVRDYNRAEDGSQFQQIFRDLTGINLILSHSPLHRSRFGHSTR